MKQRLEDFIGKCLLVASFTLLALLQGVSIAAMATNRSADDYFVPLAIASQVASLFFICLVIGLTVARLPPRETASGAGPRIAAITGTFLLSTLVAFPTSETSPQLLMLSTFLVVLGTALSILCIVWLGRSFSVMATARRLVVSGPYAIVRHPLYLAEAVSAVGVVMSKGSIAAAAIGFSWLGIQWCRALYEETILRATFPEYVIYARNVPRFLPVKF